jgi:hypothetical protein
MRLIRWRRTSAANIGPKPVPPAPHCLMADVDPALKQQVLDVAQAQRKPTYMSTTSRTTSGEELKLRNGQAGLRGRGMPPALTFPAASPAGAFALTTPSRGSSPCWGLTLQRPCSNCYNELLQLVQCPTLKTSDFCHFLVLRALSSSGTNTGSGYVQVSPISKWLICRAVRYNRAGSRLSAGGCWLAAHS